MYRDDKEAADALADNLRRENTELQDENARLKHELAARPAPSPVSKPKPAPKAKPLSRGQQRRQARAAARAVSVVRNWIVRGCVGLTIAAVTAPLAGYTLYPALHGKTSLFAAIMAGTLNQIWGLTLISQGLLGWFPDEDKLAPLTRWQRVATIGGGLVAIALTTLFIAFVGEANPD